MGATYNNLNFDIRVRKKLVCPRVWIVKYENLSKFINWVDAIDEVNLAP